jgi:hypothetical protein
MRRNGLLWLCLALSGCIGSAPPDETPLARSPPAAATADRSVMRRLMGQDMLDQPLLPQPGDIWADVLPRAETGPAGALPATSRREYRSVVAAAPGARSTQPAVPPQPAGPPHQANPVGPETAKAAPPVEPHPAARRPAMPHLAVQLAAVRNSPRPNGSACGSMPRG